MQSLPTNLFLVLCTIASLTEAQHYRHAHRKPRGVPTGVPGTSGRPFPFPFPPGLSGSPFAPSSAPLARALPTSSGSPFPAASGLPPVLPSVLPASSCSPFSSGSGVPPPFPSASQASAPYPIGNATTGAGTGGPTGISGPTGGTTRYSTRFITIEVTPISTVLASAPFGGESPASTGAVEGPGGAAPSSPGAGAPGAPAFPSGVLGGAGEPTCPVPVTITVTQDTTVTVTAPASPSQLPVESEAPIQPQPVIPSAAANSAATAAPSAAGVLTGAKVSSVAPAQSATSQVPVQEMSDGQIIEPASTVAPLEDATEAATEAVAAASTPASSMTYNAASVIAYNAVSGTSSANALSAVPAQETTNVASPPTSAIAAAAVSADTTAASVAASVAPVASGGSNSTTGSGLTPASVAASVAPVASGGSTSTTGSGLTPKNIKAGIGGFGGITGKKDWDLFTPYIGWYSDYSPNTQDSGDVAGIPMLWGNGHLGGSADDSDQGRLNTFTSLYSNTSSTHPDHMWGFYEPDWIPPDSSNIDPVKCANDWLDYIKPLQKLGTKIGSPSMAEQYDEIIKSTGEYWLDTFATTAGLLDANGVPSWDYTVIHTNKPNVTGVKTDVEHYLSTYKKPIWVAEFTCVNDQAWDTCSDPTQIKDFITESVEYFQQNDDVIAYGYNNGHGLNDTWYMFDDAGVITTPGQIYLDLIKTYV